MKKTEKLGLNILEGTDPVSVEGFNENAQLLDSLCASMALVEAGTYAGDGGDSKTLTFSKQPVLVLLTCGSYTILGFHGASTGLVLTDGYSWCNKQIAVTWDDSTNSLLLSDNGTYWNAQGTQYHYIGFLTA